MKKQNKVKSGTTVTGISRVCFLSTRLHPANPVPEGAVTDWMPVSELLHPTNRAIQALWSQNYDTEILQY